MRALVVLDIDMMFMGWLLCILALCFANDHLLVLLHKTHSIKATARVKTHILYVGCCVIGYLCEPSWRN